MLETQTISPFSLEGHTWDLKWTIVPSNAKYRIYENLKSEKEIEILRSVSSIGLIGTSQLKRIYFPTQNKRVVQEKIVNMVKARKLIRHEIIRDGDKNRAIYAYTLGPAAAPAIGIQYDENYWLRYKTEDVLKRIVFFQFLIGFSQTHPSTVLPAPEPYTGIVHSGEHIYLVYVMRGNATELLFALKHNPPKERLFIIAERENEMNLISPFITKGMKVRLITDSDLKEPVKNARKID